MPPLIPSPMQTGRPPMGAGPIGMPSANPGDEARAVAALRDVIEQLQKILPDVQIGGDLHSAVTQAIRSLSKYSTPAAADPNNQQVRLRQTQIEHWSQRLAARHHFRKNARLRKQFECLAKSAGTFIVKRSRLHIFFVVK